MYLRRVPVIRLLPDILINQIAAGEVVERPASVVKELVENALDAGARTVRITLHAGGRELIEVDDDGSGMEHDDALLALERHATSKIGSFADLEQVATLGFRGEALPSIAAAGRLALETAVADGEGTRVEVDFGILRASGPCARPRGTRVVLRDLFARLPARRKFLRTEGTELRHCTATLTGLALTRPDVAIVLLHGSRTTLHLPAVSDLARRLPDLIGAEKARAARPLGLAHGSVSVSGFLFPRSGPGTITLAVNGRVVRDRLLIGAANRALRDTHGTLEADAFLHVTLPAGDVDVNVHPTKAEVRFREPGAVLQVLAQSLATARAAMHAPAPVRTVVASPAARTGVQTRLPWRPPAAATPGAGGGAIRVSETASPVSPAPTPWGRYVGQYRDTYLVVEDGDGLLLVDQHVAHERVLFERLLAHDRRPTVQRLLIPEIVQLSPALYALAEEQADELRAAGVEVEPVSGGSLRILSLPEALPAGGAGALVERLLADLADRAVPGETLRHRVAASLACQAAIKKNRPLSRPEAEQLLRDLAAADEPQRCPHGRPIMLRLHHDEIEHRIGRR